MTLSLSGKQYFLSIIDDYTRKVWVYFLADKGEAFSKFCEWKKLVETQVKKKVCCLKIDNRLELCNTGLTTSVSTMESRDIGLVHIHHNITV